MELRDLETKKTILVCGENVDVNPNEILLPQLKSILQNKGITSFSLFIDGEEIDSASDIPDYIDNSVVEVKRNATVG